MRFRRADPARFLAAVGQGQAQIAPADLAWLGALPEEMLVTEGVWLCHGMPGNPFNTIWPRDAHFDANVSDADRAASLRLLADVGATLVPCGHAPEPSEYRDRGRAPRDEERGGYAVLTRGAGDWDAAWCQAEIVSARGAT